MKSFLLALLLFLLAALPVSAQTVTFSDHCYKVGGDDPGLGFVVMPKVDWKSVKTQHLATMTVVYFYDAEGDPLVSDDGAYESADGQVCASTEVDLYRGEDRPLINFRIPYGELELSSGEHKLKYCITMFAVRGGKTEILAQTDLRTLSVDIPKAKGKRAF